MFINSSKWIKHFLLLIQVVIKRKKHIRRRNIMQIVLVIWSIGICKKEKLKSAWKVLDIMWTLLQVSILNFKLYSDISLWVVSKISIDSIIFSEMLGKDVSNNVHFQRVEEYHISKTLKCRDEAEASLNEINRIYENVSKKKPETNK